MNAHLSVILLDHDLCSADDPLGGVNISINSIPSVWCGVVYYGPLLACVVCHADGRFARQAREARGQVLHPERSAARGDPAGTAESVVPSATQRSGTGALPAGPPVDLPGVLCVFLIDLPCIHFNGELPLFPVEI